jgi:hypothetical protein
MTSNSAAALGQAENNQVGSLNLVLDELECISPTEFAGDPRAIKK